MNIPTPRFYPATTDFDTERLIAEGQLNGGDDQRVLAQNASARLDDLIKRVQSAREEMAKARAQALAAIEQARAAAGQAAQQARAAIESANAALAEVMAAAEHARAAATDARDLAHSLADSPDSAALQAAQTEARRLEGEAQRMLAEANELAQRLRSLQPAQANAPSHIPLQVLPEETEARATDVSSLPKDLPDSVGAYQAELLARLQGVTIPPELEARVCQVLSALASVDALVAQGLRGPAETMRRGWEPIIQALLHDLGADGAGSAAAPGMGATPTGVPPDPSTPVVPADLLPANAYFTGRFDSPPPGGWFFGVGDHGRTGQDSIYEWLPRLVEARASASTHGHYLLAAGDEVTTVERHLREVAFYAVEETYSYSDDTGSGVAVRTTRMSRDEAIATLQQQGKTPAEIEAHLAEHQLFLLYLGTTNSESGDTPPVYVGRAEYLQAIGLSADVPLDLQISFNNSGSGRGDAWLDRSHAQASIEARGGPERAYAALVDDNLAANWVQIGDIGPLGDDIGNMLGSIYEKYEANTPEKQEAIRSVLFRYDERFGILANREFIAAAVETNNARRQGFFEGPVGRALLTVAASFIPGAGVYVSMMLNAGFTLHDGGSMSDALRGAAISYLGSSFGADFGNWVSSTFGSTLSPAMAAALHGAATNVGTAAVRQLLSGGNLDARGLLAAALSGGAGGYMTSFVNDSDFGRTFRGFFGDDRASRIVGNLSSALIANGGRLGPADLLAALGVAAAPGASGDPWLHSEDGTSILVIEGEGGSTIVMRRGDQAVTMNPDGTFTLTTIGPDGQPVIRPYDPSGNVDPLGPIGGAEPSPGVDGDWNWVRRQLDFEVTDAQWDELGGYVDLERFGAGEDLVRRVLRDGSEWEVRVTGDEEGNRSMHIERLPQGTVAWMEAQRHMNVEATAEQWKKIWYRLDDLDTFGGTMDLILDDGSEWRITGSVVAGEVNVDIQRINVDADNFAAMGTADLYDALERELAGLREDERERLLTAREDQRDQALADLPRIRELVDLLRAREAQNPSPIPDQVSRAQQNGAAQSTAGGGLQVTTSNHSGAVRSGISADPWDHMTPSEIRRMGIVDRYAQAGTIPIGLFGLVVEIPVPGDLVLHYENPRILSHVFGQELTMRGVELWEWLEGRDFMGALPTDATDIAAGYAGILGLPNLPATTRPEMYPTLDAFFEAYPQLRGARADSPAVRDFLSQWLPNLPLTPEQIRVRAFVRGSSG